MPSVMLLEGSRRRLPQYMTSLGGNPIGDWILQQNSIVGAAATLVLFGAIGAAAGVGAIWIKDRMR